MTNNESLNKAIFVGAVAAIVGSLLWIGLHFVRRADKTSATVQFQSYQVCGYGVAKVVGQLGEGPKQVIIARPGGMWDGNVVVQQPSQDFQKTAPNNADIKILASETVEYQGAHGAPEASGQEFISLISKNPAANVVVSFVGCPGLSDAQFQSLAEKPVRWVVVGRPSIRLKQLLISRVIQALVTSRLPPGLSNNKPPKSPQDWFDYYWQVVTPETAASLPD